MSRRNAMNRTPGRRSHSHTTARADATERRPVEVLATQLALVKLARMTGDWAVVVRERDKALHLILGHRIEDEVRRFRRVLTACTGWLDAGEDVRLKITKRLTEAFMDGLARRESPHDLLVRMQRIPRAAVLHSLVADMEADGPAFIEFLLLREDGTHHQTRAASDIDDASRIASSLTRREWADLASALLAIDPSEPTKDVTAVARALLHRARPSLVVG